MDARKVLGVAPDATDEELRAAYLRKVKLYPPDRSPGEFEEIRDAYDKLKDPRRRTQDMITSVNPFDPLSVVLEGRTRQRAYVGPDAWLNALKPAPVHEKRDEKRDEKK